MINADYYAVDNTTVKQTNRTAELYIRLMNGPHTTKIKICDIKVTVKNGVRHLRFIYRDPGFYYAAPGHEVRDYLKKNTSLYGLTEINGEEEIHEDFHGSYSDYLKYMLGQKSHRVIVRPGSVEGPVMKTVGVEWSF